MNAIDELTIRYNLSKGLIDFDRLEQNLTDREISCAFGGLDYDTYRVFIYSIALGKAPDNSLLTRLNDATQHVVRIYPELTKCYTSSVVFRNLLLLGEYESINASARDLLESYRAWKGYGDAPLGASVVAAALLLGEPLAPFYLPALVKRKVVHKDLTPLIEEVEVGFLNSDNVHIANTIDKILLLHVKSIRKIDRGTYPEQIDIFSLFGRLIAEVAALKGFDIFDLLKERWQPLKIRFIFRPDDLTIPADTKLPITVDLLTARTK